MHPLLGEVGSAGAPRPGSLLRRGLPPLVVGHRGASAAAPENTLAAFRGCWSAGVGWLETDVQPTADLVPVLLHDDELDRTTNGIGLLRERRYREVAGLDAGSWFGPEFTGETVPTLHALLSELPADGRVLLEVKGPHTPAELVAELAVIRATDTGSRVWLHSFEVEVLQELAVALPDSWRGLLREELDEDPVAACRTLGAASYHPHYLALLDRPAVLADLHQAGISVVVYTADHPGDWAALTDLGVDAIITNRPAELLAWQRAR